LLKDGHAKVGLDSDKIIVAAAQPPFDTDYASGAAHVNQAIVRLDFNDFENMKEQIDQSWISVLGEETLVESQSQPRSSQRGKKTARSESSSEESAQTQPKRKNPPKKKGKIQSVSSSEEETKQSKKKAPPKKSVRKASQSESEDPSEEDAKVTKKPPQKKTKR